MFWRPYRTGYEDGPFHPHTGRGIEVHGFGAHTGRGMGMALESGCNVNGSRVEMTPYGSPWILVGW